MIRYEVIVFEADVHEIPKLAGYRVTVNAAVFRRNPDGPKEFVAMFRSRMYAEDFARQMNQSEAVVRFNQMAQNAGPMDKPPYGAGTRMT